MPIVLKSGSLNLLEPSGPVQACDGIALPSSVSSHVFWFEMPQVWISTRHHPTYKNNIIYNSHFQYIATFRVEQYSVEDDCNSSAAECKAEEPYTERAVSELTL